MTISAKVVAHSRVHGSPDIITLQLRYPRFVHAEFMTHRVFSRNASSSRAIPIDRMIQDVIDDPAMPVAWGSNKPGMQAGLEIDVPVMVYDWGPDGVSDCEIHAVVSPQEAWLIARNHAVNAARGFAEAGYHKQIANRLLEPFGHISVVCTSTEWKNFFDLRCHPDADPTMRALAEAMRDAIAASDVETTIYHLPYTSDADWEHFPEAMSAHECWEMIALVSAARCARVSYLNHDGSRPDIKKDIALAERLLQARHMSPFEHQARATGEDGTALWGNFTGWGQHRKMVERL